MACKIQPIRYEQRVCTDDTKINDFLNVERIGVLGIADESYPYSVPLNYIWKEHAVYIHGLSTGKKIELMQQNKKVSFLVYKENGTVKDEMPCHADTSYMSVMLFGTIEKVKDTKECADVLQNMVEKYMPGFYKGKISPQLVEKHKSAFDQKAVSVYKMTPQYITAKENTVNQEDLFS